MLLTSLRLRDVAPCWSSSLRDRLLLAPSPVSCVCLITRCSSGLGR